MLTKEEVVTRIQQVMKEENLILNLRDFPGGSAGYQVLRSNVHTNHNAVIYLQLLDQLTNVYGEHFQVIEQEIIKDEVDGFNDFINDINNTLYFKSDDIREYLLALCRVLLDNRIFRYTFLRGAQLETASLLWMGPKTVSKINAHLRTIGLSLGIPNNPLCKYTKPPARHDELSKYLEDIGRLLRGYRIECQLTAHEVCRLVGRSRCHVQKIEAGTYKNVHLHVEDMLKVYQVTDEQYGLAMGVVRNYLIARVKSALDDDLTIGRGRLGETLDQYIAVIRSTLRENNYGIEDVFGRRYKLLEGTMKSTVISARHIHDINTQLRLRNILPKHDNYLFEI